MIKLTVMYPNDVGTKFDKDYYTNEHAQLLSNILGDALLKSEVDMGVAGAAPGEPAPYVVISHLTFESLESFQQSFGVNTEKILADLPNFTDTKPLVQISEIS